MNCRMCAGLHIRVCDNQPMDKMLIKSAWISILFLLAFSLSGVHTKAAGTAWVLMVVCGVYALVRFVWSCNATGLIDRPDRSKFDRTEIDPTRVSAFLGEGSTGLAWAWLLCATLALMLKTVPMLYWHDRWDERHPEIRLCLGAAGVYALCRFGSAFNSAAIIVSQRAVAWAMSISCALALLLVLVGGRDAAPTNAIPWAAGVALLSACLLPQALAPESTWRDRWVCLVGGLLGLAAVLVSETRGAYGLVLLWLLLPWVYLRARHVRALSANVARAAASFKFKRLHIAGLSLVLLVCVGLIWQSAVVQRPLQRMQLAVQEVQLSQQSLEANANTSVGARLLMWRQSGPFIGESLWWGHGQAARKAAIANWGQQAHSETVFSLGHAHNEYLHAMMDHGMWGLASLLSYVLGMLWLCFRMWRLGARTQFWALGGVLFIHASAGLTNVNFAHNYYPTMLSLAIGLILMASPKASNTAADTPADTTTSSSTISTTSNLTGSKPIP